MTRKNKQMTDASEATATETVVTEKKVRKAFVRGPQKVWAVLKLTDPQGNEIDVRKGKGYTVELTLSKDQGGVIDLLTSGAVAFVTELEVPKASGADEEADTTA